MPTTISSNIVMTRQAGGNEAAALINATVGNLLGIVLSPLLLLLYLGTRTTVPFGKILLDLAYTVLIPLVVGQIVQYALPAIVKRIVAVVNLSYVSNCMLLLLVYATFCDAFSSHTTTQALTAGAVVAMVAVMVALYVCNTALCFGIAQMLHFAHSDTVAVLYCGATKTMALGVPLINIVYKNDPNVGLYSVPLLIYHATQLFVGGALVRPLRQWSSAVPLEHT